MTTDPYGQYWSPYLAMGNNPVMGVDPDGGFWQELGNWFKGNGWMSNDAVAFAESHPNWTWNSDRNNFTVAYKETDFFEKGGAGVSPTFGPVKDFWQPFKFGTLDLMTSLIANSSFSKTVQAENSIYNPLGKTTIKTYTKETTGKGILNINYINESKIDVSLRVPLGVGTIAVKNNGLSTSLGVNSKVSLGLSTSGLTLGYSNKSNGFVHGTSYTWEPSKLWWNAALAPVVSPRLTPVRIP